MQAWLESRFGGLTDAQHRALPHLLNRGSLLLMSPTGSGKTLAAFLPVLQELGDTDQAPPDGIYCVYVSPLRALAYDIQKNVLQPIRELGWESQIRVGLRSSDTLPAERAKQKRNPPHILVTTPESLAILLAQPAWDSALQNVRWMIVDEIHALASGARGAHLSLSMERLEHLVAKSGSPSLVRVGLSATAAPATELAQWLVGADRHCAIEQASDIKELKVSVYSPLRKNPYPAAGYTGSRLMSELAGIVQRSQSLLIFTNTRSGAEQIGIELKRLLPKIADKIETHHSSVDRNLRLEIEDRLKEGELRAVVCSTSLEMGIDIGQIDCVVMVSAPKGVSRAIQRIGRSGHQSGALSTGILMATNIGDLAECVATATLVRRGCLDPVRLPDAPLDVLAQHLVGIALSANFTPEEGWQLIRRAHPYRNLSRNTFDSVIEYLEGGGRSLRKQYTDVFGKIRINEDGKLETPNAKVGREYLVNIGTIPAEGMVRVLAGRKRLGEVEESFIKRLQTGDLFVIGGKLVRLEKTGVQEAKVRIVPSGLPTVPRWNAHKMPLASGVAREVIALRTAVDQQLSKNAPAELCDWLVEHYEISKVNAEALVNQFQAQRRISVIPISGLLLIEHYHDGHLHHFFIHSLIGRSANDALSRLIAFRVQAGGGGNAMVTIDDYGFLLTLAQDPAWDVPFWQKLFSPDEAAEQLRKALQGSQLVKWQFRGVAQTGLMVPRNLPGKERQLKQLRWGAELLFQVLEQHEPDHPLLLEAYRQAEHNFLDTPQAFAFLQETQNMRWQLLRVPVVSPLSFGMYASKIREGMMFEDPEAALERIFAQLADAMELPTNPLP